MNTMFIKLRWLIQSFKQSSRSRKIISIALLAVLIPLGYGAYRLLTYVHETVAQLTVPPVEVKGKIVTLRALREEYYIDYHNAFSNDVRKGLSFPEHITLGYTIKYLQDQQRSAAEGKVLLYCIFDNKDNKLIGSIEIRYDCRDDYYGQLGVWINENYRGGGRFREALALISKVYFQLKPEEKNYIIHIFLWNNRSYQAHKNAGCQDVGYFYENGKATIYILEMKRK